MIQVNKLGTIRVRKNSTILDNVNQIYKYIYTYTPCNDPTQLINLKINTRISTNILDLTVRGKRYWVRE